MGKNKVFNADNAAILNHLSTETKSDLGKYPPPQKKKKLM